MQRVLCHRAGLTEPTAALVLITAFGNGPNLLLRISQPLEKHPVSKYLEPLKLAASQEPLQRCVDTQCAALLESSERPGNRRKKTKQNSESRGFYSSMNTALLSGGMQEAGTVLSPKGAAAGVSPGRTWKWEGCPGSGGAGRLGGGGEV